MFVIVKRKYILLAALGLVLLVALPFLFGNLSEKAWKLPPDGNTNWGL